MDLGDKNEHYRDHLVIIFCSCRTPEHKIPLFNVILRTYMLPIATYVKTVLHAHKFVCLQTNDHFLLIENDHFLLISFSYLKEQ